MGIVRANYVIKDVSNFHDSGYLSEKTISEARSLAPDTISRVLTYLQGDFSSRFPLTMFSEGQFGSKASVQEEKVDTVEFTWDVIGDIDKADEITASNYSSTDSPGIGTSEITVSFKTNWLKDQHVIASEAGTKCRVMGRGEKSAFGYTYKLALLTNNELDYVSYTELAVGKKWIMAGPGLVSASLSYGNESNLVTGGKMKGQLSMMRKSFHYAGHINRVVECWMTDDKGQKQMYWMPFAEWQHEIQWKTLCENQAWKGVYNRYADGRIPLKDPDTGLEIISGAGFEQQIPHYDTYTTLTTNKIDRTFLSAIHQGGQRPDGPAEYALFCGKGFRRDWDLAFKNEMTSFGQQITGDKFVKEYKGGLMYGGYFTAFKTNEGDTITLHDLPILDEGPESKIAPKHPVTGYPMPSHSAYLVDMSTYNGERNVKMVYQKNRMLIKGKEQGMTVLNDGDYVKGMLNLATSQDKTSVHYFSAKNPALINASRCFYLQADVSMGV